MKAVIERISGTVAVLVFPDENLRLNIPPELLPPASEEGDIVTVSLERDEGATREAHDRVSRLISDLIRK
ncbi:MAG TPA: DUF3006 domain-containing protein [Methanoregula sp.]|mgnify:CR=1 FL=1|nr:DUF3006 domain-containing protein [Methanoregula sp.]